MENNNEKFPWLHLLILSSVTFMAILSELAPSGILPEMSKGLGVSYSSIGFLVSVYAIASVDWQPFFRQIHSEQKIIL